MVPGLGRFTVISGDLHFSLNQRELVVLGSFSRTSVARTWVQASTNSLCGFELELRLIHCGFGWLVFVTQPGDLINVTD